MTNYSKVMVHKDIPYVPFTEVPQDNGWVMFALGMALASQCYTIAIWALRLV